MFVGLAAMSVSIFNIGNQHKNLEKYFGLWTIFSESMFSWPNLNNFYTNLFDNFLPKKSVIIDFSEIILVIHVKKG